MNKASAFPSFCSIDLSSRQSTRHADIKIIADSKSLLCIRQGDIHSNKRVMAALQYWRELAQKETISLRQITRRSPHETSNIG